MKAVIVEIKDNVAAVLSEDGRISKIRNKKYSVGQEIVLKKTNTYIKIAVSSAAAMMLFTTTAWAYFTPYSYVSIDINPSFEFSINRFDRVLNVKAMNYDGERVADGIGVSGLRNKEIKEAVKTVIVELKNQGYIDYEKRVGIVVAASSKSQEKTDMLAEKLKAAVEKEITNTSGNKEVPFPSSDDGSKDAPNAEEKPSKQKDIAKTEDIINKSDIKENDKYENKEEKARKPEKVRARVEIIEVSSSYVDTAKANGVTPGKWSMVEQLKEKALKDGHEFGENEFKSWLDKPVKDIMKEINKYNKEEREIKRSYVKDKKEKEDNKEEKEDEKRDQKEKSASKEVISKEKEIIKYNNNKEKEEKETKKDSREKESSRDNKSNKDNKDDKDDDRNNNNSKNDKKNKDEKNNKDSSNNKAKENKSNPGDKGKRSRQ